MGLDLSREDLLSGVVVEVDDQGQAVGGDEFGDGLKKDTYMNGLVTYPYFLYRTK